MQQRCWKKIKSGGKESLEQNEIDFPKKLFGSRETAEANLLSFPEANKIAKAREATIFNTPRQH